MTDELKNKIEGIIRTGINHGVSSYIMAIKIAEIVDEEVSKAVSEGANVKEILDAFDLEIRSKK